MICPQCHYQMDAFDALCPKCHGQGLIAPVVPNPRPARPYGRWIGFASVSLLVALLGLKLVFNIYTHSQHDAVLEAVLQDSLHPKFTRESKEIFFVSVYPGDVSGPVGDGDDPPDSLLSRFKNEGYRIRKASQAIKTKDPFFTYRSIYRDKETGEKGWPLRLGAPTWSFPLRAKVYRGNSFSGENCIVVRKNGRWMVWTTEMSWIS